MTYYSNSSHEDIDPDGEPFIEKTALPVSAAIYGRISFKRICTLPWKTILNLMTFCLSIMFFSAAYGVQRRAGLPTGKNALLKATSMPSPVFEATDIPLVTKKMNGSLLETKSRNIFRQPPSPEVDAAWDRLQTRDIIHISREDVIRLGKDPEDSAKFPESFGFGPEAYVAKIDVFHQIHCLNTVRKSVRSNFPYYYGKEFPGDTPTDKAHDLHVTHCINALLENLMCTGNVDLYTMFWMDAQAHPFPDFFINKKCRNFDAILAWQEENAVSLDDFESVRAPEDYKVHVMSKEFKDVVRWHDRHHDHHAETGESA